MGDDEDKPDEYSHRNHSGCVNTVNSGAIPNGVGHDAAISIERTELDHTAAHIEDA